MAVLGACNCRGRNPEPCSCACAAAHLKRDIVKAKEEVYFSYTSQSYTHILSVNMYI